MGSTGEATDQDINAPDCSPIHPRILGQSWFKPCLGLVTSCCGHQTACWRPACCWLEWGSLSIGDPSKSHQGRRGGGVKQRCKHNLQTSKEESIQGTIFKCFLQLATTRSAHFELPHSIRLRVFISCLSVLEKRQIYEVHIRRWTGHPCLPAFVYFYSSVETPAKIGLSSKMVLFWHHFRYLMYKS